MSLQNTHEIDRISTHDCKRGKFFSLVILDEDIWDGDEHLWALFNKIRFYMDVITMGSDDLDEFKKETSNEYTQPMIELVCVHVPENGGWGLINDMGSRLEERNVAFCMRMLSDMSSEESAAFLA